MLDVMQIQDELKQFGLRVKQARIARNISAGELARRMDISLPTLRKIEVGDGSVSMQCVMTALWIMGLSEKIPQSLEHDSVREFYELQQYRKKTRKKPPISDF